MAASYRLLVNGGESTINLELQEGDYSPLADTDMPGLVWALGRAIRDLHEEVALSVTRTAPVATDVPEV
ncbi:hypothetical protein MUK60_07165 [Streptomyces sp. LRE541]|uniref:hypothetical protein n=1 Tax=Streptomyces sp. LRE541 TaxID=2931983 RepID=UPI00200D7343|nr:hypothetical protein [Streptomyces sp. LRE541]UPZ27611.1 hypothetical protein MUK60_07165 [Streptomyces sp. LRE541]